MPKWKGYLMLIYSLFFFSILVIWGINFHVSVQGYWVNWLETCGGERGWVQVRCTGERKKKKSVFKSNSHVLYATKQGYATCLHENKGSQTQCIKNMINGETWVWNVDLDGKGVLSIVQTRQNKSGSSVDQQKAYIIWVGLTSYELLAGSKSSQTQGMIIKGKS